MAYELFSQLISNVLLSFLAYFHDICQRCPCLVGQESPFNSYSGGNNGK